MENIKRLCFSQANEYYNTTHIYCKKWQPTGDTINVIVIVPHRCVPACIIMEKDYDLIIKKLDGNSFWEIFSGYIPSTLATDEYWVPFTSNDLPSIF